MHGVDVSKIIDDLSAITCVTTTKFFGVIINHEFKWNDHIAYDESKILKSINFKVNLTFNTKYDVFF